MGWRVGKGDCIGGLLPLCPIQVSFPCCCNVAKARRCFALSTAKLLLCYGLSDSGFVGIQNDL